MIGWGCVQETEWRAGATLKIILGQRDLGDFNCERFCCNLLKTQNIQYFAKLSFKLSFHAHTCDVNKDNLGGEKTIFSIMIIVFVKETMVCYLVSRKLCFLNIFILSDELMLNLFKKKKRNRTIQ